MYVLCKENKQTKSKLYIGRTDSYKGQYITVTDKNKAIRFETFDEAMKLLRSKKSALCFIKGFRVIAYDNEYVGRAGIYAGDKAIDIDMEIINNVENIVSDIINVPQPEKAVLEVYNDRLNEMLSFCDSALSDMEHIIEAESPAAHIRTKIYGIQQDLLQKRRKVKHAFNYVKVLLDSINDKWDFTLLQKKLMENDYKPYKGRTDYYNVVLEMLK